VYGTQVPIVLLAEEQYEVVGSHWQLPPPSEMPLKHALHTEKREARCTHQGVVSGQGCPWPNCTHTVCAVAKAVMVASTTMRQPTL